ncbi:hypothetical protein HA466_0023110 [Hirschfeldia incana]|nr:hypothetical protein HA466_0023110 [Hirschfeldia incana]
MKEKNSATASTLGRILATCSKQVMIIRMALPRSPGRIMLGYILWYNPQLFKDIFDHGKNLRKHNATADSQPKSMLHFKIRS